MWPGRGLPACQVISWSIQPFGQVHQRQTQDRQTDNGLIAQGKPIYEGSPKTIKSKQNSQPDHIFWQQIWHNVAWDNISQYWQIGTHQKNEMFVIFHILKLQSVCKLLKFLKTNIMQKHLKYNDVTTKSHAQKPVLYHNIHKYIHRMAPKRGRYVWLPTSSPEPICMIFGTLQCCLVLNTSLNSVIIKFITQSGASKR